MTRSARHKDILAPAAQNLARILIASYFIAVAIGFIAGTDGLALTRLIAPTPYAELIARGSLFALAFFLLNGIWLRPAALMLAGFLLWSNLAAFISPAASVGAEQFWRDLAMIGALFLTYSQSERRSANKRSVIRVQRKVRRAIGSPAHKVRRIKPMQDEFDKLAAKAARPPAIKSQPSTPAATVHQLRQPTRILGGELEENIFVDFEPGDGAVRLPA